ncbi:MAG: putative exocyst complex component 6-like [Trebouxia sp. A1-2]|nr:MAG: putative exocyst complex component 6-like [Trebouxia sp. A1-2]
MASDNQAAAINDLVETALGNEDIAPLVRFVFDNATELASVPAGRELNQEGMAQAGIPAQIAPTLQTEASAQGVLTALYSVAEDQGSEIASICRANADEMAASLQELGTMQTTAADLRARIQDVDAGLNRVGKAYLHHLTDWQEHSSITSRLTHSVQAVAYASKMLRTCSTISNCILTGNLSKAQQLLERTTLQWSLQGTTGLDSPRLSGSVPSRDSLGQSLGQLQPYITGCLDALGVAIQHRAISDINDWLVNVRAAAKELGMKAIKQASVIEQREKALTQQRKSHRLPLASKEDLRAAAAAVANGWLLHQSTGKPQQQHKKQAGKAPPAVATADLDLRLEEEDLLKNIDMTLLHRCIQIHKRMGRLQQFRTYMLDNRRQQLTVDLAAPVNFSEAYQGFIAQIVGFFIVEERVQAGCGEVGEGWQLNSGWEAAVATLKARLESACASFQDPAPLLSLKDFTLLGCTALGQCGYSMAPIKEVLLAARNKFHDVLGGTMTQVAARAVNEDDLHRVDVQSEADVEELQGILGLALQLDVDSKHQLSAAASLHLPCQAPFTSMVPEAMRITHSFVESSIGFLSGLVVVEALQHAVDEPGPTGSNPLPRAMQLVTNISTFMHSLPHLDEFTTLAARGDLQAGWHKHAPGSSRRGLPSALAKATPVVPVVAPASPHLGKKKDSRKQMKVEVSAPSHSLAPHPTHSMTGAVGALAAFQAVQGSSEAQLLRLLVDKASAILEAAKHLNWLPDQPPRTALGHSAYIQDVLPFLKDTLALASRMLPLDAYNRLAHGTFGFLNEWMMNLVTGDAVPAFNMYGLFRLADDLASIQALADASQPAALAVRMAEVVQTCTLLVTGRLEEIVDPAQQSRKYPAVQLDRLSEVLTKFREIGDKASSSGHHLFGNSKQPASFLKKQTVDQVRSMAFTED